MNVRYSFLLFVLLIKTNSIICWTDEDLYLFDLVESTDRKFYDILGVDQKATANDIRKAYRRLSQQYHPDKNKDPGAEETFRKIAAISEVLRNEEQRKKYDVILQTGLPDWREPVYYYRRVRNMGLIELIFFLFCLATFGQYLLAWAAYWEKKYEFEEIFSSRLKKRAKQERKSKHKKAAEDVSQTPEEIYNLPKPRCQDLFPVRLFYFFIGVIVSSPSYVKFCLESLQSLRASKAEDLDQTEVQVKKESRPKTKKHFEPIYPEFERAEELNGKHTLSETTNGQIHNIPPTIHTRANLADFKKALKKFPNGTLQRWNKVAEFMKCDLSEIVQMAKNTKVQQFAKNVPISSQGLTGIDDFQNINFTKEGKIRENGVNHEEQNGISEKPHNGAAVLRCSAKPEMTNCATEVIWKQEEQRLLEIALQTYPKETPARWDRIAEYIKSKTKEECITRYRWLAQEIKRKKDKEN